ncbi:DUF1176 domain-containing protein [uncultured Roseibium sp.]|uniref:DUF1176 domain-containing protein n=1 Tax=uncultured Roseibium sp. TaxID=1936171 RepID=UPI0026019D98|nr:DUF1176 domain-containing protein [uncultured Roseibium sp.]
MTINRALSAACMLAIYAAGGNMAQAADDDIRVSLKLFGKEDIEQGIDRCRFSLWQGDRDPNADRYAFLFHANAANNGYQGPARVKIGETVYALSRLAEGGESINGLASQYFYATEDREIRVHIEFNDVGLSGELYRIKDADMTVIQKGKVPFVASAKGHLGCLQPPAQSAKATPVREPETQVPGPPNGIPIGRQTILDDMSQLPPEAVQLVRESAGDECDVDGFHAWGGARYVINDYYLLWEVPCISAAYQAATALVVTQNPPQGWGNLLTLPNPPGEDGETYQAMNADILGPKGFIRTTSLNRGVGDCGSYRVHRLIDAPGEVLELELLEFREKSECDGIEMAPEDWPLIFQAY